MENHHNNTKIIQPMETNFLNKSLLFPYLHQLTTLNIVPMTNFTQLFLTLPLLQPKHPFIHHKS
jgi:hypothetical protein